MLVISQLVYWLVTLVLPYDVLALEGMRSVNDPIMALFFVHPFVLAFAMAIVYASFGKALSGSWLSKGKAFGLAIWLVAGLPSAFLVYSSMDYPIGFTVNSLVGSFIYLMAAALVIAKLSE